MIRSHFHLIIFALTWHCRGRWVFVSIHVRQPVTADPEDGKNIRVVLQRPGPVRRRSEQVQRVQRRRGHVAVRQRVDDDKTNGVTGPVRGLELMRELNGNQTVIRETKANGLYARCSELKCKTVQSRIRKLQVPEPASLW